MHRRTVRSGLACLTAVPLTVLLLAGPALAEGEIGVPPAPPVGLAKTLVLFVLAPAVILLVIAAAVWLPGMARGTRYRPGKGWAAAPVWFAGPADLAAGLDKVASNDVVRGGARGNW